jgi:hypothetical protein
MDRVYNMHAGDEKHIQSIIWETSMEETTLET